MSVGLKSIWNASSRGISELNGGGINSISQIRMRCSDLSSSNRHLRGCFSALIGLRSYSSKPSINPDSVYVISIPITTKKSYIHCNHKPKVLSTTQIEQYPWVHKLETKITTNAAKGWHKIANSEKSINKKITKFINRLLNTIPYEENCLRSFPSKKTMIREINLEQLKGHDIQGETLLQTYIDQHKIPPNQIKRVPLYYADFQSQLLVETQLNDLVEARRSIHIKYASLCAIGIPISLPVALVPVLPNIPGFYLAYRLYCNLKALSGIDNLKYLLQDHLQFKPLDLKDIYLTENEPEAFNESVQEEERVLITEGIIKQISNKYGVAEEDLNKALRQERSRIQKEMKMGDAVE